MRGSRSNVSCHKRPLAQDASSKGCAGRSRGAQLQTLPSCGTASWRRRRPEGGHAAGCCCLLAAAVQPHGLARCCSSCDQRRGWAAGGAATGACQLTAPVLAGVRLGVGGACTQDTCTCRRPAATGRCWPRRALLAVACILELSCGEAPGCAARCSAGTVAKRVWGGTGAEFILLSWPGWTPSFVANSCLAAARTL